MKQKRAIRKLKKLPAVGEEISSYSLVIEEGLMSLIPALCLWKYPRTDSLRAGDE